MPQPIPLFTEHRLKLCAIWEAYPAVVANDGIDLSVDPGDIHAVVGENGAGKLTLMKIIYGLVRPGSGEILRDDHEVSIATLADAQKLGTGILFQQLALSSALLDSPRSPPIYLSLCGRGQ